MKCNKLETGDWLASLGEPMDPHVEECPDCRARYSEYMQLAAMLAQESPRPLPSSWKERVFAPVRAEARGRRRLLLIAGGLSIAAVAVALIIRLPSTPRQRADAMQARGQALLEAVQLHEAGEELSAAFDRHIEQGDHADASIDARLLSRVHSSDSRYDQALRWAETARVQAEASDRPALIGSALTWFGNLHLILGDVHRATEAYEEAAAHLSPSDTVELAQIKIYQGRTEGLLRHSAESERLLEDGLRLAEQAGDRKLVRAACINLASLAIDNKRLDDAERYLRQARATLRPTDRDSVQRALLLHEAVLARERGRLEAATDLLDKAEPGAPPDTAWEIERERALIAEQAGKFDKAVQLHRGAIKIVEDMRGKYVPEEVAAAFFEERWEPFGDLLALQLRRGDVRGAFATLAQAQGRMFLDALAVSYAEQLGPPGRAEGPIGRLTLLGEILPLLDSSSLGGAPPSDPQLPALRGRHVLAYFSGRGRMHLLAVLDGQPRVTSVDIDLDELDRLLGDFRAHPDDERAAAALGEALLPADALPPAGGRLHVVPTGPLMRLPFAPLRVSSGQRLVDRHEIVYVPSVKALAVMTPERELADGPRIVIADSGSNLASVGVELSQVVARTGAVAYAGAQATAEALRAARSARLLHVISHSGQDRRGGYLILAGGEKITATQILDWHIRPRLVVLPTCGSAVSLRSEMWDSLATAFLASGSEHVVATLTSVEGPVAAEFTRLFYAHHGLTDPVGATARVQREMARTHGVAAWSAFMVAGL